MQGLGRLLIFVGIVVVVIGFLFVVFPKIPYIGKLPGDIYVKKDNFSFYFPLASCLILSIIVSLILYFLTKH
ncbi:MAG: DUF2905 domain-containing protein [Deltaproteobacteria bacterium]|nr:DUF2905 domain-containing protein [Deltaproteobacteria bacterium]